MSWISELIVEKRLSLVCQSLHQQEWRDIVEIRQQFKDLQKGRVLKFKSTKRLVNDIFMLVQHSEVSMRSDEVEISVSDENNADTAWILFKNPVFRLDGSRFLEEMKQEEGEEDHDLIPQPA